MSKSVSIVFSAFSVPTIYFALTEVVPKAFVSAGIGKFH